MVKPRKPYRKPIASRVLWICIGALTMTAILVGSIGSSEGWFGTGKRASSARRAAASDLTR